MVADGAATRKQLDDSESQVRVLGAQLDALATQLGSSSASIGKNVMALEYQREQVEEQLTRSAVKAPISGTVLEKFAEAGEYAVPGKPLVKMGDLSRVYLRAYFTAEQLADIKLGQKVTVTADYGADKRREYTGTITHIASESQFTPKSIQTKDSRANLVYEVKVSVENDGLLKPGQYGEVKL